jgi:hypothetical protein
MTMIVTTTPPATTIRRRARKSMLLAAGCLSLAIAVPAFAAQPAALKPFTATYQANYMGLHGTGTMTLAQSGGDRWKYSLEIDSAIAQLSQNTLFEADGGQWKPLSNSDSSILLIKKSSRQASYDWNRKEARWSGNVKPDRAGPVALRAGDLDAMLVNLAIPRDVTAGKPLDYRMVDDGRAKPMNYEVVGQDTVQVGGKPQKATKVSRSDGNKQTVIWVVAGLPVPARILQRKDGKDEMDLQLKSVR